ncbi:MAG: hypothetical protein KDI04_17370, partial [Halieaceae bacterium]|nr:hypothetical protein [Halieaceae bacterium]
MIILILVAKKQENHTVKDKTLHAFKVLHPAACDINHTNPMRTSAPGRTPGRRRRSAAFKPGGWERMLWPLEEPHETV